MQGQTVNPSRNGDERINMPLEPMLWEGDSGRRNQSRNTIRRVQRKEISLGKKIFIFVVVLLTCRFCKKEGKKMKRKRMVILMLVFLLIPLAPLEVHAEPHTNQVHVIVENYVYGTEAGAPWEGRRIDTWITLKEDSTGVSVLAEAVGGNDKLDAPTSAYGTYINGILGITAGDGGSDESGYNMAGWLYLLNDTVPALGIDQCSVAAGTLSSGDELAFCYSLDGGTDIGYDWSNNTQKALKALTASTGLLSPAFSSDVTTYSLTIHSDTEAVVLSPEAENKNEIVTIFVDGTEYKRAMELPVHAGTKLVINCKSGDGTEETDYTIYVKQESEFSAGTMYSETETLLSIGMDTTTAVYGNEWLVFSLARAGKLDAELIAQYCTSVESALQEAGGSNLDSRYATTNARVILALSAAGISADSVNGYNLLEPLADMDYINRQGLNAAIYTLLALDSNHYTIPTAAEGVEQTTREGLLQTILNAELAGGGWAWSGSAADADLTATAIVALAPYYNSNSVVKETVDRALQTISAIQNPDGSFSSMGTQNACSTAQVLTALTVLGIDPNTDERFLKNEYTVLDALGDFYLSGGGFHYDLSSSDMDAAFSTVQAFYALVSYNRMSQNQNSLFDMTDAFPEEDIEGSTEAGTTTTAEPAVNPSTGTTDSSSAGTTTAGQQTPATGDTVPFCLLCGLAVLAAAGAYIMNDRRLQFHGWKASGNEKRG